MRETVREREEERCITLQPVPNSLVAKINPTISVCIHCTCICTIVNYQNKHAIILCIIVHKNTNYYMYHLSPSLSLSPYLSLYNIIVDITCTGVLHYYRMLNYYYICKSICIIQCCKDSSV